MFVLRDLVSALLALLLIWPLECSAGNATRPIRQATRQDIVARQSRTLTAHRRQTSPIPNCGVPSGVPFYLHVTGSGISGYVVAGTDGIGDFVITYTNDPFVASSFSLDAGTCNLDYNGNVANIQTAPGPLFFDPAAQVQANGFTAATCMVSNNELSCSAQGETLLYSCGADQAFGLGSEMPNGCSEVSLTLLTGITCGLPTGTTFALQASGSGTGADSQYALAAPEPGVGSVDMFFNAGAALSGTQFYFYEFEGACDLAYSSASDPFLAYTSQFMTDYTYYVTFTTSLPDTTPGLEFPFDCALNADTQLSCTADQMSLPWLVNTDSRQWYFGPTTGDAGSFARVTLNVVFT